MIRLLPRSRLLLVWAGLGLLLTGATFEYPLCAVWVPLVGCVWVGADDLGIWMYLAAAACVVPLSVAVRIPRGAWLLLTEFCLLLILSALFHLTKSWP